MGFKTIAYSLKHRETLVHPNGIAIRLRVVHLYLENQGNFKHS